MPKIKSIDVQNYGDEPPIEEMQNKIKFYFSPKSQPTPPQKKNFKYYINSAWQGFKNWITTKNGIKFSIIVTILILAIIALIVFSHASVAKPSSFYVSQVQSSYYDEDNLAVLKSTFDISKLESKPDLTLAKPYTSLILIGKDKASMAYSRLSFSIYTQNAASFNITVSFKVGETIDYSYLYGLSSKENYIYNIQIPILANYKSMSSSNEFIIEFTPKENSTAPILSLGNVQFYN